MFFKKTSFFLALFALIVPGIFAHAQAIPGIQQPLVVSVIPNDPRPNQTTIINVESYSIGLDRALITWFVDGVSQASGVGLKQFRLVAGPAGSTKIVDVTISTLELGTVSETIVIRPADVGLLWESDTYTPPFYKGKALHSYNGSFKVIAIPEMYSSSGAKLDAKDLIYTWKKNGEVDGAASGYGKNVYVGSQTSYLREGEDISVEVAAPRDNVVASNSILITPTVPRLAFYEKSPLYGIMYERALKNRTNLKNEEITMIAEPLFFSVKNREASALTYTWSLNGTTLTGFEGDSEITLRRASGDAGRSSIKAVSQNRTKLLQGASEELTISYE